MTQPADVKRRAHEVQDYVVAFRRDLHMNPEPSLQEFRTTDKIAEALDEMGVTYRRLDPTGLIAEVKGKGPGKTVALRADIDALSIAEKHESEFKSQNDGFMHACGHDSHAAMLVGAVKVINDIKDDFNGTVRFIFQPAEEVAKGATKVIEQGGLDGVDAIFGVHITTMEPAGRISSTPGPGFASADQFSVVLKGKACHGAQPHTGTDATVCAAALIMNLQTIVSREINPSQPLVVTIGSIASGSRFNIISGEAVLTGTVRSFDRDVHAAIPEIFERIVKGTAATFRCEAEVEYNVMTEVLVNDEPSRQLCITAAKKIQTEDLIGEQPRTMGGEDFAEYLVEKPGAFFRIGGGGDFPLHSDHMFLDESSFETGVAFHVQVALDYLAQ